MMDIQRMTHILIPDTGASLVLDLLWVGYLIARYATKLWQRPMMTSQGSLLLQIEAGGHARSHIALLQPEDRGGKVTHVWKMSQIHQNDFPYFARTDLSFSHIWVTQKRGDSDLVTISVVERTGGLWNRDFYWIKSATIGTRPGFPRKLLLPQNFVLEYVDECQLNNPPRHHSSDATAL